MRDFTYTVEQYSAAIELAKATASARITSFLQKSDAAALVFGASSGLDQLIADWTQSGPDLDGISVIAAGDMDGADALYITEQDLILLSDAAVETASPERLVDLLVEEVGHRIDARVNATDTPGDEGKVFAAMVRGEDWSAIADDQRSIDLPGLGPTEVEQAVSVSDSGGFEGSSQTLTLEGTSGGEITYSYQHFTIPDRFIIRYEGRNLLDTGFTGGSRSGTLVLPAGTSDQLQVIVATDDAGTAWNYSVSVEAAECEVADPWIIAPQTGEWTHNDQTDKCEVSGTLIFGREDGVAALIRAEGATASGSVDDDKVIRDFVEVKGATVYALIGGENRSLFTGDFKLNLNNGIVAASDFKQTATGTYELASMEVDFKSMALLSDVAAFDIDFKLPDELGAIPVSLGDFINLGLRFSQSGSVALPGFKIQPPGKHEIKNFLGYVDITASGILLEYRAQEDALRFQSKIEFANAAWTKNSKGLQKLEVDLAGPTNYLQLNTDGQIDAVGKATATTDVGIGGWSLKGMEVTFNTTSREIGGSVTIGTPFGTKFGEGLEVKPELEFITSPDFELDKVGLTINNINKPIPAYPLFFFQSIGGSVDNFASSNTKAIELAATIGASLGPQIGGIALAKASGGIKVSSEMIEGTLGVDLLPVKFVLSTPFKNFDYGPVSLAKLTGTQKLDWKAGFFENTGALDVLDGFYTVNSKIKIDKDFNFGISGKAEIGIPNALPSWAGGGLKIANSNIALVHTNDGNSSNDFAAGWGSYIVNTPFAAIPVTLGLRASFDGSLSVIGADNIPKTSSWFISGGRDYVMLTAEWTNASSTAQVRVIKPDGTVIDEADFTANRIAVVGEFSDETNRTVIIDAPEEGTWDLELVDDTGLGPVNYFASGTADAPGFDFTGAPLINADGTVTYSFEMDTPASAVSVNFFYDDDLTDLDGIHAGAFAGGDGPGSFTWDPAGVVPGDYFLYAIVDDGQNPITIAETAEAVSVGSAADVGVTIETDNKTPTTGDTLRYTVIVTNNSTTDTATDVVAHLDLPDGVTRTDASEDIESSDFSDFSVELGDLAPGETRTFTIDVEVDETEAGTPLAADVMILSESYDPVAANDMDVVNAALTLPVSTDQIDLQIESSLGDLPVLTRGETFTYDITIENVGTSAATDVQLTELLPNVSNLTLDPPGFNTGNGIQVNLGTILPGETQTVQVTARADIAGPLTGTSTVRAPGFDVTITDNQVVQQGTVVGSTPDTADLSIEIAQAAPDSNGRLPVNISIANAGPGVGSSIEVRIDLPAGVTVAGQTAVQGTYDQATGIWALGNMRDNLTRTLELVLEGDGAGDVVAEVVSVAEADPDSTPDDGEGDDFASLAISVGTGSGQALTGTDDADTLTGTGRAEEIDALAGDDTITPGGGDDTVTTGDGADQIIDEAQNLFGDTVTDLTREDEIVFQNARFGREDVDVRPGSAILGIDLDQDGTEDGAITALGDFSGGDFMAVNVGADTHVSFQTFLPSLKEKTAVDAQDVNGIANPNFLIGDGTSGFRITADGKARAGFENAVGVYEINGAGEIVDVRMIFANANTAKGSVDVTGVEAGHKLGFFIVQDAAEWAETLATADTLSFVDAAGDPAQADGGSEAMLAVNGTVFGKPVWHSHDAALNSDGVVHALSGVTPGGMAMIVGFEDLAGGGDRDYQDVLFLVESYDL